MDKRKKDIQEELFQEHYELLKLIFTVGNKVAMQKQLRVLMELLNVKKYNQKHKINNAIKELEEYDIVGRNSYENTNNQIVSLKYFATNRIAARLEAECEFGFTYSRSSVGKKRTNARVRMSVFNFEKLIMMCSDTYFLEGNNINTIDDLINYVTNKTSMTFQKHRGFEYFTTFVDNYGSQLYLQDEDIKLTSTKLRQLKETRADSVPDRTGQTKEKSQKKKEQTKQGKKFSKSKPVVKNKNKNDIENDYNAFLERKSVLSIEEVFNKHDAPNGVRIGGIQQLVTFRLDVFDIHGTMDAESLGDKIKKTYGLLKSAYSGKLFLIDIDRCKKCEHYDACIEKTTSEKSDTEFYIKRISTCSAEPKQFFRDINLKVYVHMYNKEDMIKLKADCNNHGYYPDGERKSQNKLLSSILSGNFATRYDFDNCIDIEFVNLDLESKYLEANKRKNLNDTNKKKQQRPKVDRVGAALSDVTEDNTEGIMKVINSLSLLSNQQLIDFSENIEEFFKSRLESEDI